MRWRAMRFAVLLGALLLALGVAAPARAQKSADTLRVTWRDGIPDLDFYYNTLRVGLIVQHHVWDTLVDRDPDTFQLKPLLATGWRNIDDTTIEFTLRDGVTFQNGDRFTADDVVYTIRSILDPKSGIIVPSNYTWLAGAEKIDDNHVRLKLARVFPAALEYLAMVLPIYPEAYRERVGHAGFSKMPIGTGPYKFTHADGSSEMDLVRNDAYFAGPKGKPAIRNIAITVVSDASSELTSLLSGRADWIWQFSPDQFDNISRMPNLTAVRADSMRVGYLSMDAAGRTGADNPFTKQKVRQAVFYAIDRQSIARNLVQGGARVLDAPCYPTQFGCDQDAAVKYTYDPAKAKQLLAEAGYPERIRHRDRLLHPPAMDGCDPELPARGRHPRPRLAAAGGGDAAALDGGQGSDRSRQLGQQFDQRRLRLPALFLRRRRHGLHARSGGREAGRGGGRHHRSRQAARRLCGRDPPHHRAGILAAAQHLRHHLCLLEAAQLQAVSRTSCPRFYLSSWK